ncbi:MAG: AmmeMemoRadiSam system protein B, partial [Sphingobacteriales bacterium]
CALANGDFVTTPLGSIPIDKGSYTQLLQEKQLTIDDQAYFLEH